MKRAKAKKIHQCVVPICGWRFRIIAVVANLGVDDGIPYNGQIDYADKVIWLNGDDSPLRQTQTLCAAMLEALGHFEELERTGKTEAAAA